jgi:hypothetical protein
MIGRVPTEPWAALHGPPGDPKPSRSEKLRRCVRDHPETAAFLFFLAVVLIANAPYVAGIVTSNPLALRSGLAVDLHAGLLSGQSKIDPNNGFVSQAVSYRAMVDLIHGHLPWWNSYEGLGAPLAAALEAGALFPFTLFALVGDGQLLEILTLQLITAWATYRVLCRLGLHRSACLAGGALFALNGTFAWFGDAPTHPIAFLPLAILGVERAYSATLERRRGGWGLLAVAGALSLLAGFPEVTYIDTLVVVVWAVWRLGCLWTAGFAGRQMTGSFAAKAALGAITAILLSGPLLVALLDYLPHLSSGAHGAGLDQRFSLSSSVGLPGLLLPDVYGPIFAFGGKSNTVGTWWGNVAGFLPVSTVLLALLGLISSGRRVLKFLLTGFVLLALARNYGLPLGGLMNVLPGMSEIAFYRYSWPALEFAVVVLVAFGVDSAIQSRPRPATLAAIAAPCTGAVALAVIKARSLVTTHGVHLVNDRFAVGWGLLTLICGVLALFIEPGRSRTRMLLFILLMDAGVLFAAPELSAPRSVKVDLAPVAFLRSHLHGQRFYTLGPIQPNYGSYFGLDELDANDGSAPKSYARFVTGRLAPSANPLIFVGVAAAGSRGPSLKQDLIRHVGGYRAAGVAYVLTNPWVALPESAGFTIVDRTPTTWIYHLSGSRPYFSVSAGCRTSRMSAESAAVTCPRPGRVLKREIDMPGWSATVDGTPVPVRTSSAGFQTLSVPAGRHVVRFDFTPPREWLGWAGLIAGLLVLSVRLSATRVRHARVEPPS